MNRNMIALTRILLVTLLLNTCNVKGQVDSAAIENDSLNYSLLLEYRKRLADIEDQRLEDSIKKNDLEEQLKSLKTSDNIQKETLLKQLKQIEDHENNRILLQKQRIESLKTTAIGYPVLGILKDTLFLVYSKIGSSLPKDRAINITQRIEKLFDDDFLSTDSITCMEAENTIDIVYGETIIMSVSETDALWQNMTKLELASGYLELIKRDLMKAKDETSLSRVFTRVGLLLLVLVALVLILWSVNKGFKSLLAYIEVHKDKWLRNLTYKDYTFITAEQEYNAMLFLFKPFRWLVYLIILYIALPVIFSIFPFTRSWADDLFSLIWKPFKGVFVAVWDYFPNLFAILVIYFVMKYVIRLVKYIFGEIESEKLKISGFHSDWAMPTFSIVKFLLYAFMFVLIFPYLPGSDSPVFKGVSVFIGVLFSLGSSSAVANMVAGLVITYMRPFKIGDRIKIGDVSGDVEEKTLLVTRIKTIKNEIVTIPNSAILSGNTINYSTDVAYIGLILHTTVTIGYDVPWMDMHNALIEAALRTEFVLHEPKPFVLQTSLDDFYVSYQINAYTKEANKQAVIYSNLHQNILDVCNEKRIEIMSPHYRAQRDGNMSTIPEDYLNKDYKAPAFKVKVDHPENENPNE